MVSSPISDRDIRVTFILKGEEAREFRRYLNKQKGSTAQVGRKLAIKGMKHAALLPNWWRE